MCTMLLPKVNRQSRITFSVCMDIHDLENVKNGTKVNLYANTLREILDRHAPFQDVKARVCGSTRNVELSNAMFVVSSECIGGRRIQQTEHPGYNQSEKNISTSNVVRVSIYTGRGWWRPTQEIPRNYGNQFQPSLESRQFNTPVNLLSQPTTFWSSSRRRFRRSGMQQLDLHHLCSQRQMPSFPGSSCVRRWNYGKSSKVPHRKLVTWILHLLFWSRITSMSCYHSSQSCAMQRYWREGCQNPRGRLLWCLNWRGQVWIQLMSKAIELSQTSPSCWRSLNGSSSVSWWSTSIRTTSFRNISQAIQRCRQL